MEVLGFVVGGKIHFPCGFLWPCMVLYYKDVMFNAATPQEQPSNVVPKPKALNAISRIGE